MPFLRRCTSRFGSLFGSLDRGNTTPVYPMGNRCGNRNCADEPWYRVSRVFLVLKSLGLIWAICFASTAPAQNRYQIIRIPVAQGANSAALGINNKGEVVGYSFQGEDYQTFLYSSSEQSLTGVGSFGGNINAACAINDAGQVTGYSQDGHGNLLAFVYSRKQPIASLGTLEGASTSEAFGINNSGSVVGDSQGGNQKHRPVLFSNGSIQDTWRFANRTRQKTDANGFTWTETVARRKRSGGNAKRAERGPEFERSKAISDSRPAGITWEP